jgi:UDP-glucose-4-epimerase
MKTSKPLILLTGGAGYIGAHTAVELFAAGYEVLIVDNFSNSDPSVLEGIEKTCGRRPVLEAVDCADATAMAGVFAKYPDIAAVIHFAAAKAVGESVEQPLYYYRNNIGSLLCLLEEMKARSIPHLVFSSSCTVYGAAEVLPVTEDTPVQPAVSPYGKTKQICEGIIEDVTASTSIQAIMLRYFNPIGAHPLAWIGEEPRGVPQNLVPFIVQTASGRRPYLQVFGGDYPTPDGSCIRDYIYVVDLAKAHVAAVKRLLEGRAAEACEVFNLGTGRGYSVLELIAAFEQTTGIRISYKIIARRPGDIAQIWAQPLRAQRELHWEASTPISEALASAWNWEQSRSYKIR